jgi:PAS domain S-box-containing protein
MGALMGDAETLIQTALLGEAVDAGPALIFIADEEMRYVAVNECACKTLGYTREELLAKRVDEIAREPETPTQYDEMLARGFRHGTAILTRKDGTTVDMLYRASKTQVAGMVFFVSVGFAADEG